MTTEVTVHAATHRGLVRKANEDCFAVGDLVCAGHPASRVVSLAQRDDTPLLCVVADGLGGHRDGARASAVAVTALVRAVPEVDDLAGLTRALDRAQAAVYSEMNRCPASRGMGTTVAGLLFAQGLVFGFNVGDSRYFQLVEGTLVQLSVDDAPPGDGTRPVTAVTRSLGGRTGPRPVDGHPRHCPAHVGDAFLICSDGLTDHVVLDALEEIINAEGPTAAAVQSMITAALDAGAPDNVTALLAVCTAAEEAPSDDD